MTEHECPKMSRGWLISIDLCWLPLFVLLFADRRRLAAGRGLHYVF